MAEAVPILSRIVERWPDYAAAQVAYAKALQQTGDSEASFAAWTRAESLVSRSDVIRSGLHASAVALLANEERDRAASWIGPGPPVEAIEDAAPPDEAASQTSEPERPPVEESIEDRGPVTAELDSVAILESVDLDSSPSIEGTAALEPPEEVVPEYSEESSMDPVQFVPIAAPVEPASIGDMQEPEWVDQPRQDQDPDEANEAPMWDGGYEAGSGDGAGPDVDAKAGHTPEKVDLDRLIGELESARIVPVEDPSTIPAPDLSDDIEDVVSETLARIYATQKQFSEAARVYDRLALENPDRAKEFEAKASEMRDRAQ